MAIIQCNFFSKSLMRTVPIQVVLPTDKMVFPGQSQPEEKPFKTLYLLHGIFGNYTDWVSGTRLQAWAQDRDLAVVMPSGDNSFYVDNRKTSALYGSFIAKDLVEFTRRSFPLSRKREDTFIGGLSMGGFGAIVNGLQHPETFGRVVGLSAALILDSARLNAAYTDNLMTNRGYYESVFGDLDKVLGGENDYTALAERVAGRADAPRFYLACGTEDGLIAPNRVFKDKLQSLGYDVTWVEGPGVHDWKFWDEYILKAMEWLPLGAAVAGVSSGHVSE
ncbi:alpha/beta hydrolase [Acutalibacter caecimuris]|uniref:alpha/beta hydrolase n=1 Tax=Acutalibacter caecimuris TaxID=3093657 RepID=UPI002AC8972B|nr:alpha/beta hydrolase family protein [Acutalibacter sp. M00118]